MECWLPFEREGDSVMGVVVEMYEIVKTYRGHILNAKGSTVGQQGFIWVDHMNPVYRKQSFESQNT